MYYNVIVRDTPNHEFETNELVFTFYDINEAFKFARKMFDFNYHIEILQFEDKGE